MAHVYGESRRQRHAGPPEGGSNPRRLPRGASWAHVAVEGEEGCKSELCMRWQAIRDAISHAIPNSSTSCSLLFWLQFAPLPQNAHPNYHSGLPGGLFVHSICLANTSYRTMGSPACRVEVLLRRSPQQLRAVDALQGGHDDGTSIHLLFS